MRSSVLKNLLSKITFVVFLCLGIVFLSAFIYPKKTNYLTRLDLAILMEKILKELPSTDKLNSLPNFLDLSSEQKYSIKKILKYKIMNGYSDNSFRPNEPLHNLEVIAYLQRLSEFLRNNNPDSYSTKQLFRFLSYSEDPSIAFEYSPLNFSKELENPNRLTSKDLINELEEKLIENNKSTDSVLTGIIIDSITNKPVTNAFISANNQAMAVNRNGGFKFILPNNTKTADIFAVAENYLPIEIRKDLDLSKEIIIRLKPVVTANYNL